MSVLGFVAAHCPLVWDSSAVRIAFGVMQCCGGGGGSGMHGIADIRLLTLIPLQWCLIVTGCLLSWFGSFQAVQVAVLGS